VGGTILPHAEFAFTVTVFPLSIVTISPATGQTPTPTAPPPEASDQVVLTAQFPLALEKYVAANVLAVRKVKNNKINKTVLTEHVLLFSL
jgi:hypothetical protein